MRPVELACYFVAIMGLVYASDEPASRGTMAVPVPQISARVIPAKPIPVPTLVSVPSSMAVREAASVSDVGHDERPRASMSAWIGLLEIADGIAEAANGVFMWTCPSSMLIREDSMCVQVRGTRLSAAATVDEFARVQWDAPWQDAGAYIHRWGRWYSEGERRSFDVRVVVQDGYTVLKPLQPMMLPLATYDGVLIGMYISSDE